MPTRIITTLTPNSLPGHRALGLRHTRAVASRNTPVVVAPGRPFPVVRAADAVIVAHLAQLGGVFDHRAEGRHEVAEDVVARPVATRAPRAGVAGLAQAP